MPLSKREKYIKWLIPGVLRSRLLDVYYTFEEGRLCRAVRRRWQTFSLNGEEYRYFSHRYNHAYCNERTVEIPVALRYLKRHVGQRVLEVGNVLRHYVADQHLVVDKFERAPDVLNVDICEYAAPGKFDLVISISTFEHIGFDEERYAKDGCAGDETSDILTAIENAKRLLAPGGAF